MSKHATEAADWPRITARIQPELLDRLEAYRRRERLVGLSEAIRGLLWSATDDAQLGQNAPSGKNGLTVRKEEFP